MTLSKLNSTIREKELHLTCYGYRYTVGQYQSLSDEIITLKEKRDKLTPTNNETYYA